MNMHLQLILPSLALPLLLSIAYFGLTRHFQIRPWGLALLWLPSAFWLIGLPTLAPEEANDWLWLTAVASTALNIGLYRRPAWAAWGQLTLLALTLLAIAWPVLRHQPEPALGVEIAATLGLGAILCFNAHADRQNRPALTLALGALGLALVSALDGSLLLGQLSGALAAVLGAFALHELYNRPSAKNLSTLTLIPLLLTYLALLLIARIYAEISLPSSLLLLVAPLAGWRLGNRLALAGSLASVAAAVTWVLLTADSSSYY